MTEANKGIGFVLEKHGDAVLERETFRDQEWVTVAPDQVHDVVRGLRDEAGFTFLDDLTAVDYLDRADVEGRFRVVSQLLNMETAELFRVKVKVEDEDVEVPTVSDLFGVANWLEREIYDMFGIRFSGHPDLRRLLMAEDWEGFPCRRYYDWHGPIPIEDPMRDGDHARQVAGEEL